MSTLLRRKPEIAFLASLLVLALTLVTRAALDRASPSVSIDMSAPAPVELGSESVISGLQERIRLDPEDTAAYAQLGLALLQRVRETGDPGLYTRAEAALAEALKRDPNQIEALTGQGQLALARHQFTEALRWGEQARAINPYRASIYGIIGDAQVELGQYEAAAASIQKMVDTRPDLSSYSRVSYLRELRGDTAGAIDAMAKAVDAGGASSEGTLWTQVQLGHLYFHSGDLRRAEDTYNEALRVRPDYVYAAAGIARVRAAQGRTGDAIRIYKQVVTLLPLPEFVIALGDLYELAGDQKQAREQFDLVRAMQQLNANAGMDVDLELALFEADHGADPAQTVAKARAAYERRPGIYGADALAWSLYRAGQYQEAATFSREALRLETRDAALHYRAGMIARALNDAEAARTHLQQAIAINPHFSPIHAPEAQRLLDELGGGK